MLKAHAGFEAKQKPAQYINEAMRASSDFQAYLEGRGSLPEGARFPVVAGKSSLQLYILMLAFSGFLGKNQSRSLKRVCFCLGTWCPENAASASQQNIIEFNHCRQAIEFAKAMATSASCWRVSAVHKSQPLDQNRAQP